MNLWGALTSVEGFSLDLLEEIIGLQRKKELQELLFSHQSNGTISFHHFSQPPPFGSPLPPLFSPICGLFQKGQYAQAHGKHEQGCKQHFGGCRAGNTQPESLKLSVVPDLLRYSVLSKTSPCIPRAISYSYQGKSLVLSLRYRTGGIGRANSERKSPPHPPGLSGTERHQTFCWKMDV